MAFKFLPLYVSNLSIQGGVMGSPRFFNRLTLHFSYDPEADAFTRSLVMSDRGSIEYYGATVEGFLEARGLFTQSSAEHFARARLDMFAAEVFDVSFSYSDTLPGSPAPPLLGVGLIDASFAPTASGAWKDKPGLILSVDSQEGGFQVSLTVLECSFPRHLTTDMVSSTETGQVRFEGTTSKTLTITETSGAPAVGILVSLNNVTKTANSEGQVTFEGLKAGSYQVRLSGSGYLERVISVQV